MERLSFYKVFDVLTFPAGRRIPRTVVTFLLRKGEPLEKVFFAFTDWVQYFSRSPTENNQ
jgi:hypothetical protein